MSSPILLSTLGDWAAAIIALPAEGPLPQRTVLVPSERHAHALRRELLRRCEARVLAGTRFVSPAAAAAAVLEAAGVPHTAGEEALRPARLLRLFREDLSLEHLDLDLLRSTPGWDEALASATGDLEAAGLAPADLPDAKALLRDLRLLWTRAAEEAGTSWTTARVQLEAAALLARGADAWPWRGRTLVVVSGHETAAAARFISAIPGVTLAFRVARPLRRRHLDRIGALFGPAAATAIAQPPPGSTSATERDLLATYLFERPEVVAADRPRSHGPDGTVQLEEHAGVEAEVEAAADWVARKVLEGLPLEDVAVLVAAQDPLAQLVADRLERLELTGAPLPVYVAGGVPASSTAAGARVLAAIRAVSAHLAAEALAPVLPALRLDGDGERTHLTHGEAMEVAYSLGTVGGNAANPRGALAWSARASARVGELEAALRHARSDDDSSAREVRRLERTLKNLAAIRPALDALVGVARRVVEGAPLAATAEALCGFLSNWILAPGEGAAIPARLTESLASACGDALGKTLAGGDALEFVEQQLLSMRVPRRRFGEPAVYVGTVASAAGLEFRATRVVGLCEGVLPSQPHENPVLPERVRELLEAVAPGRVLPRAADRVALQAHGLFAAVAGARGEIVLSAPRVDVARTEREASAVLIEVAAAIARPHAITGAPAPAVPDSAALARDYFAPARQAAAAFRTAHPVSEVNWLVRAAGREPLLPPAWSREPVLALDRVAAMRLPTGPLGPLDGVLGPGEPFPRVPGIDPDRPISASALQQLLQCPRMFLMRRILGWDEPAGAPPLRELDPLSYGSLLHRVVEDFYREHGEAFVARTRTLGQWKKVAFAIADRVFDEFLSEYPLVGERVREKERERLHESLGAFVDHDWVQGKTRRFVGVELGFGQDAPLQLAADGVTLHLQGFIDRVDVEDGVTVVRDLKSGKAHPRRGDEEGPTAFRDVQLGVYSLAMKKLAGSWKVPKKLAAAYVYASGRGEAEERAFRGDFAALEEATLEWLATAGHLLAVRAFPPTLDEKDCKYCPFLPVCGAHVVARACEQLEDADGPLGRFGALKLGGEEDDE
jgi:hypothetical protein